MLPPTATCHTADNGVMATPVVSRYAGAVAPASLIPSLCPVHPPRRSSLETTSFLGVVRNSVEDCAQLPLYHLKLRRLRLLFAIVSSIVSFLLSFIQEDTQIHRVRVYTLYTERI